MSPISKTDLDQISMTIASAMSQGFAQLTAALSQPRAATAQAKTSYRYSGFLPKGLRPLLPISPIRIGRSLLPSLDGASMSRL